MGWGTLDLGAEIPFLRRSLGTLGWLPLNRGLKSCFHVVEIHTLVERGQKKSKKRKRLPGCTLIFKKVREIFVPKLYQQVFFHIMSNIYRIYLCPRHEIYLLYVNLLTRYLERAVQIRIGSSRVTRLLVLFLCVMYFPERSFGQYSSHVLLCTRKQTSRRNRYTYDCASV